MRFSTSIQVGRRVKTGVSSTFFSFFARFEQEHGSVQLPTMAQPDLSFLDVEAGRPPRDLSNLKLNESIEVTKGSLDALAPKVRQFIIECADLCMPAKLYVCDGSDAENESLLKMLHEEDVIKPLTAYKNR